MLLDKHGGYVGDRISGRFGAFPRSMRLSLQRTCLDFRARAVISCGVESRISSPCCGLPASTIIVEEYQSHGAFSLLYTN